MLRIENLKVVRNGVEILKGISLNVERGKIHSIIGPNGSGKTTLAYTLIGGYKQSSGKIWFNGEEITNLSISERAKKGITMAWQEPARFEGLTVNDYLSIGNEGNVEKALRMVNLEPGRYQYRAVDNTLSGGERKRIELASIVTMRPKLAILDEPDSGIDFVSLDDLLGVIQQLKREGITILLITHREDVARATDHATLICDGFTVKDSDPWEVTKYFRKMCKICPSEKYSEVKDEEKSG